ncbi:DedA family protein [Microbacterium sp. RD1]|uniref:DedA family protein n=1 Tax=Microbacterium sp. RD1 TaxID=3457313 RepID=UPI003FA595B4
MQWIFDLVATVDAFLIDAVASPWMLLVLLAVCIIDGFFPPVPSEIVLLTAATVTWGINPAAVLPVIAVAALGAWMGDGIAYLLGRRLGITSSRWARSGRRAAALERVRGEFERRPASIILTGRFIPVARVLVNVTAGAMRMPYPRFAALSAISASAWAISSAALAVLIGGLVRSQPLLGTAIAVSIALTAGLVVDRILSRRRRHIPDPEPVLESASC